MHVVTADRRLLSFPRTVDEVSARLVAAGVFVMGAAVLVFRQPWILVVMAIGFVLRTAAGPKLSPLALLMTRAVRPRLSIKPRTVSGPPKRFAQSVGAVFTIAASVLYFAFGLTGAAYGLTGVLVLFAGLESFVGFCMGCKVFALLMRIGVIPDHICADCADIWAGRA